jgi:hypothetical protein
MENSELAQYSCTKLLREMEVATDSDSDMDDVDLEMNKEDELVHLLETVGESIGNGLSSYVA